MEILQNTLIGVALVALLYVAWDQWKQSRLEKQREVKERIYNRLVSILKNLPDGDPRKKWYRSIDCKASRARQKLNKFRDIESLLELIAVYDELTVQLEELISQDTEASVDFATKLDKLLNHGAGREETFPLY